MSRSAALVNRIIACAVFCVAAPAIAQPADAEGSEVRTGPYMGVQPGRRDTAPGKSLPSGRRVITWIGFEMASAGGRVFVQTNGPPVYKLVPGASNEVVVDFPDTRLRSENDGRPFATTGFPTAVASVEATRHGRRTTRLRIKLRETVGYDMRQQGNYLFLEFRPPTQALTPVPSPAP